MVEGIHIDSRRKLLGLNLDQPSLLSQRLDNLTVLCVSVSLSIMIMILSSKSYCEN